MDTELTNKPLQVQDASAVSQSADHLSDAQPEDSTVDWEKLQDTWEWALFSCCKIWSKEILEKGGPLLSVTQERFYTVEDVARKIQASLSPEQAEDALAIFLTQIFDNWQPSVEAEDRWWNRYYALLTRCDLSEDDPKWYSGGARLPTGVLLRSDPPESPQEKEAEGKACA